MFQHVPACSAHRNSQTIQQDPAVGEGHPGAIGATYQHHNVENL